MEEVSTQCDLSDNLILLLQVWYLLFSIISSREGAVNSCPLLSAKYSSIFLHTGDHACGTYGFSFTRGTHFLHTYYVSSGAPGAGGINIIFLRPLLIGEATEYFSL